MFFDNDKLINAAADPVGYAENQAKMAVISDRIQFDFEEWILRNAPQSHHVMRDVIDSLWVPDHKLTTIDADLALNLMKRLVYIGYQRCLEGIDRAAEMAKESA